MINGSAAGSYPIVNYEYAIVNAQLLADVQLGRLLLPQPAGVHPQRQTVRHPRPAGGVQRVRSVAERKPLRHGAGVQHGLVHLHHGLLRPGLL